MTKEAVYAEGLKRVCKFLVKNKVPLPRFVRYEEPETEYDKRMVGHLTAGQTIGYGTGMFTAVPDGPTVYVNVARCANVVFSPGARRWSYPCWKTDRTPMGVLAHEIGHHCEHYMRHTLKIPLASLGAEWRVAIRGKKVSSYEPVLDEAWAETFRLFVLNPDLLANAIPARYDFVRRYFTPSENQPYATVLCNHKDYVAAAERWIAK